jgi:hypothetical protein
VSRPDATKLDKVGQRVKYARLCREITVPVLVKYRNSWAPASWQPTDAIQALHDRESSKAPYAIDLLNAIADVLDVPRAWLRGDVSPYPPPIQPLTEIERFMQDGNLRRYGERFIQSHWRGAAHGGIRV